MNKLIEDAYKIADKNAVILKGNIKISGDVYCLLFAHYCDSTLFYKRFFKISKDVLKVNIIARKNLKEIKKLLKSYGYINIRTKGVFSIYGDLRPLAVEAGFGKWGDDGIIENEKSSSQSNLSLAISWSALTTLTDLSWLNPEADNIE